MDKAIEYVIRALYVASEIGSLPTTMKMLKRLIKSAQIVYELSPLMR